jgi:hypothetical protein
MKTTDFNSKITSTTLAENIEKQFDARVDLNKYDREQLEDIRNKLRTRIFQQEGANKINDLLTNETYQKNKAMLELLNTRIKEMLGEQMQKLRDKMSQLSEAKKSVKSPKHTAKGTHADRDYDGDGNIESGKDEYLGSKIAAAKKAGKMKEGTCPSCHKDPCKCDDVKEGAKPDFLDMDKDGNKKEPMKKAAKDAKVKEGFPTVADAKARAEKEKTTGKFDKKSTSTGTVYTKKHTKADSEETPEKQGVKSKFTKEGFPTVDDAKKNAQGTSGMKTGDKQKSSTGGTVTKTTTGLKHTAGKNYGGKDAPKAPDSDKKSMKTKEGADKEQQHAAKTTMKHIKNPTAGEKRAAKDIKPGSYADRAAMLRSAEKDGRLKESNRNFKHNVKFVNESLQFLLQEDEEGKAKTITAAGDMVNDFTSWMQRVGQYQTKAIIELADAIRADFGQAEAEAFKQAVGPALSTALETLTQQREAISNAVAVLAGEATTMDPMGMEPSMEPGMDMSAPDEMNPMPAGGDEFAGSDAAAGGAETAGRAMRENRNAHRARKLAESHSIMSKLAR